MSGECVLYEMDLDGYKIHGLNLRASRLAVRRGSVDAPVGETDSARPVLRGDVAEVFLQACEAAGLRIRHEVERAMDELGLEVVKPLVTLEAVGYLQEPWPVFVSVGRDVIAEFYAAGQQ